MSTFVRKFAAFPILVYQKTLSFDHGPLAVFYPHGFCPYFPSCSEYCRQAIEMYGVVPGIARGAARVLRCHPWTEGGVDKP